MYEFFQVNVNEEEPNMTTPPDVFSGEEMTCAQALAKAQEVCVNRSMESSNDMEMPSDNQQSMEMPSADNQQSMEMPSADNEQSMEMPSTDNQQSMDNDMMQTGDVMETFQVSPNSSMGNDLVKKLMYALLFMCLFYLLSHQDTMKWVMSKVKGLNAKNAHLLMTLVFGICFMLLKRYL